ncbi:unnamed protein product [Cyberlindnera jadinii]|uniref:DASH complex subunit DUO1 n=1 Tax=Cyberlindnera jadinii (strain ATCC 18201 / CBS 1600 / BCRC 20928 / JCM 3617 / NBRC 0987 / NRRL Y-1542) TaxID=983966 RepID=A0A0H5C8V7_CYBJN|nr:hypothetical protein CYBJADRAFT_17737 [Cyberlindnera jadinii NRRL Y-1542]ODV72595.1 hypothetical protein CYBJADRAFT_17737 [Cyberlindnera jadinii NRRL Y-1542]CEP24678.1 unnamed protein product [Cyberlindnera jadinii]
MSKDIVPALEAIQATIDSTKKQQGLTGAARVKALEKELEQLDAINESIESLIDSMQLTSGNLETILTTSTSTNALLDLWIKILSQTSYTANLLSDKNWKGLTRNEEEYQQQLKRFEVLNKRYNAEKLKREQEQEAEREKRLQSEQRKKEREETLRRRVYGSRSSTTRPATSTATVTSTTTTSKTPTRRTTTRR